MQMEQWNNSIGMANREQRKTDVLQGTLDLMVLQTLDTLGPLHGYAIAARFEQEDRSATRKKCGRPGPLSPQVNINVLCDAPRPENPANGGPILTAARLFRLSLVQDLSDFEICPEQFVGKGQG
jgi:hypothetical protein